MLLAPLNSGISVFLKKVRFSAVAFCLSSSLSLPQASFPHQDQTAFAFLSADSENREKKQALSVHLPLQAAQCQVNPKACIFSFYRLHSLLFDTMNSRFCCHFTCVFSLILLYDFLMFSSISFSFLSLFDQCIWLYPCHQDRLSLQDHQDLLTHHSPLTCITLLYLKYSSSSPCVFCILLTSC